MALLTSHLLNGQDGTHASGVSVSLIQLNNKSIPEEIFSTLTDQVGRFSVEFKAQATGRYDLVVRIEDYFNRGNKKKLDVCVVSDIVIRFITNDPDGKYHIPIIISPNSYSCWWSSPQGRNVEKK